MKKKYRIKPKYIHLFHPEYLKGYYIKIDDNNFKHSGDQQDGSIFYHLMPMNSEVFELIPTDHIEKKYIKEWIRLNKDKESPNYEELNELLK